jgi:hypothetical protein
MCDTCYEYSLYIRIPKSCSQKCNIYILYIHCYRKSSPSQTALIYRYSLLTIARGRFSCRRCRICTSTTDLRVVMMNNILPCDGMWCCVLRSVPSGFFEVYRNKARSIRNGGTSCQGVGVQGEVFVRQSSIHKRTLARLTVRRNIPVRFGSYIRKP